MGNVELNIYERTILFLLSPIILPLGIGFYAASHLTEKFTALLPAPNSDQFTPSNDNLHQRLYKCLILGDTHGFTRISILTANNVEILSSYLTPQKNTFLHIVSTCENHDLAITILKKTPLLMFKQNDDGDTPLHIAAKTGKSELVKAFLHFESEIRSGNNKRDFHLATDATEKGYQFLHNIRNNQGNTALHEALINAHIPSAQLLINTDSGVMNFFDLLNKENKSPFYLAVEAGNSELVQIIKQKAVAFNDLVCLGKSPMHAAVLSRSKEILEMLWRMKLNIINPKDENGKTPLHYAISTGYLEGVRFLLGQSTIDAYHPDQNGVFPIHTAASKGLVNMIEQFLQYCPDSGELLNKNGQNILHIAAKCGRDNVVKYVLKNRMLTRLINLQDNNGDTPLHLATKYRHPLVVSTLTWFKRTRLELVNNEGFTVLDIAEGNMDSIASFHGRLTWIALKSAGARRAQHLHVLLRKKNQLVPSQMPWTNSQIPNFDQMQGFKLHSGSKLPIFDSFKDRVNTLLLVTTLVATVTFAAGFTLPGGYNNTDPNQGMATMLAKRSLQIFVICDTIAMYCSIIVAVTLIWAQLGDLNLILSALRLALPMLGVALSMMSIAFTAGVYTVVSNLHWLGGAVLGIGGMFEVIVLVLFVPLFFPSQSTNIVVRYITYYPFRLVVSASGNYNEQLEE